MSSRSRPMHKPATQKDTDNCTLSDLKKVTSAGASLPMSAKNLRDGTFIVHMSGSINYRVTDSPDLRHFLLSMNINV